MLEQRAKEQGLRASVHPTDVSQGKKDVDVRGE